MSTEQTLQIDSTSSEVTEKIAQDLGSQLKGGEVIELTSDLGGGKTTFVRGLALGAGSTDHVSSPTFTISNVYKTPNLTIHHFDFYRLHEAGLIGHELQDVLDDPNTVIVVEWSDVVKHVLPPKRLKIYIETLSENERRLIFQCPRSLDYLLSNRT
jgi:tRNA threonylcarbamoyladenosine biosynthesis protein TsaE